MAEPKITPLARRLAEENGIDWRSLKGSGPDETIVERDILGFLAKVMAGEIELPPEPEELSPPEAVPDISEVQDVLAREGVNIGELVPDAIPPGEYDPEPAPSAEEAFTEEEPLFEMSFDTVEETPHQAAQENTLMETGSANDEGAPGVLKTTSETVQDEPLESTSSAQADSMDEPAPESKERADITLEWEDTDPIEDLDELDEDVLDDEPLEFVGDEVQGLDRSVEAEDMEAAPPFTPPEIAEPDVNAPEGYPEEEFGGGTSSTESLQENHLGPGEVLEETAETSTALDTAGEESTPATEELAAAPPSESEPAAGAAMPEQPERAEEEVETEPSDAPLPGAVFPPAFRRAVDLGAAERARADLSTAWRSEVPLELLLYRAVDRALAELEVPMRPVLGRFQDEEARALAVQPAVGLRDLYEHLLHAEEGGEGLIVLDLSETPYAEVILPDRALVTLGRAGLPEGLGLLSISGELPTDRTRFLERVAFYLERPILLA